MQRAMGGMEPPGPPMMKQSPKQGSAPPSPQRKESPGKKPPMLTKQQSISQTGKGVTPPTTPKQKTPGPEAQKSGQKPPPLQKAEQSPGGSPQHSPTKTKQDGGGFFGGFSLGGSWNSSKQQGDTTAQANDSVTGKLFSGFGGLTETPKSPVATSQATEGVSGKKFGFGSSILSSATNFIAGEEPKSPPGSVPGSPRSKSPLGSPLDSTSPLDTPPVYSKEPASAAPQTTPNCPLCKVELNMGSKDAPNYSICTECQKAVCNLCGFRPMPHLSEVSVMLFYQKKYSTCIGSLIKLYEKLRGSLTGFLSRSRNYSSVFKLLILKRHTRDAQS